MIGRAPHPAPGVVEAPGDVEGRPRAPAQAASRKLQKSSAWEHDQDRRLRPLIIAVLALPLPPGAARRIAQMVVEEFILAGGLSRGQLQPVRVLRAELEGEPVVAAELEQRAPLWKLIIAVLALPLPPGAARRIAQMVVEEFILAGGPLRMQLRQLAGLRAELEGALILAAKDDRRISL